MVAASCCMSSPDAVAKEVNVVIFQFDIRGNTDLKNIQSGISVLLPTRLIEPGKIAVIDRYVTNSDLIRKAESYSLADKMSAAKSLGADYVLAGSITRIGKAVSIDARLIKVDSSGQPAPVFVQCPGIDSIIPELTTLAKQVKEKIYADTAPPPEEAAAYREQVSAGKVQSGDDRPEEAADDEEYSEEQPEEAAPPVRRT